MWSSQGKSQFNYIARLKTTSVDQSTVQAKNTIKAQYRTIIQIVHLGQLQERDGQSWPTAN